MKRVTVVVIMMLFFATGLWAGLNNVSQGTPDWQTELPVYKQEVYRIYWQQSSGTLHILKKESGMAYFKEILNFNVRTEWNMGVTNPGTGGIGMDDYPSAFFGRDFVLFRNILGASPEKKRCRVDVLVRRNYALLTVFGADKWLIVQKEFFAPEK